MKPPKLGTVTVARRDSFATSGHSPPSLVAEDRDLSDPVEVRSALTEYFAGEGKPFLWLVDNIPVGLEEGELREWFAPYRSGKTLITTRSRDYTALTATVEPGVLTKAEARDLLALHRVPTGDAEWDALDHISSDLGLHALALEVAGAAVAAAAGQAPYADFRAALDNPAVDELEWASQLADVLPTGHEPNIARTLMSAISALDDVALDVLRIASRLASAPSPPTYSRQSRARRTVSTHARRHGGEPWPVGPQRVLRSPSSLGTRCKCIHS